jgi:mono/diheme cytochrome c family protein
MTLDSRFALLAPKTDARPDMTKLNLIAASKLGLLSLLLSLVCSIAVAQDIPTDAASISAGEALFTANCKTCHKVHQKLVGPALADVYNRAPSIDWIKSFIKNSQAVIASGDDYAVKLYNEYNKTQMTAFTSFKDEQIMQLLAYIKAETDKGPEVAIVKPTTGPDGNGEGGAGIPSSYLNAIVIGLVLILVLLVVILGFLVSALKRFLDTKELSDDDREQVDSPITLNSIVKSSGFTFIVVFLVGAIGFKALINGLYSIGVQQGYAPKQPIAFSHKIHAGQYEIECKYCHTGVLKGKSATIPSVNICMNCHNQIKEGALYGTAELSKITEAYEKNIPVQWVRIHNLPDLAYFNHAQHVNVGGIECQTCHGPIQEMEVVQQYSLLTMGWCIDCHRKTDVNAKGNAYYDKLVELHNKSSKSAMKVEDIGGLECAKCHY